MLEPRVRDLIRAAILGAAVLVAGMVFVRAAGATSSHHNVSCYYEDGSSASAKSFCAGYAEADCDAAATCDAAAATCEAASASCDQAVNVSCPTPQPCPDVTVEGAESIGNCRRCRVKEFKDGSKKTKCQGCAIRYTTELRPY